MRSSSEFSDSLDHTVKQLVDFVFTVAEITSVNVVIVLLAPSAGRCVEFEGPEEVIDLLEDASNGEELVDHVLDALNVVSVAQLALDDEVVGDRNATSSVLDESTFVEQITSCLQRWIAIGDVRLGDTQHVERSLVKLDKCGVVDLTQAEKLKDLLDLRCDLVDTTDADNEGNLRSLWNVDISSLLSFACLLDDSSVQLQVCASISLSADHVLSLAQGNLRTDDTLAKKQRTTRC